MSQKYGLVDEFRPGGWVELNEDVMQTLVELVEKHGFTHSTIHRHRHTIEKVRELGQLGPYKVSGSNGTQGH